MRIAVTFHDGHEEITVIESDVDGFWNLTMVDSFFRFTPEDTIRLFNDATHIAATSHDLKSVDDILYGSMSALIHLLTKRREVLHYIGCYSETS